MNGDRPKTREDRLAARLRDNLRRRKQQARALNGAAGDAAHDGTAPEDAAAPPLFKPDAPG